MNVLFTTKTRRTRRRFVDTLVLMDFLEMPHGRFAFLKTHMNGFYPQHNSCTPTLEFASVDLRSGSEMHCFFSVVNPFSFGLLKPFFVPLW